MKKLLLIALATCAFTTGLQAAPATPDTTQVVTVDTTDIATRANTTGNLNEYEYIIARRSATVLISAQNDLNMALDSIKRQRPVVVKKKPIRAQRTNATSRKQIEREEKPTPRAEVLFNDGDTLPGEDRD